MAIDKSLLESDSGGGYGFGYWESAPTGNGVIESIKNWFGDTFYLANPDGTRADVTVGDLLKGPTIEFEDTPNAWYPSIFMKDPFKAGTTVRVKDGPNGEVIVVEETDASKTQLVGGDDDETQALDIGTFAAVGLVAALIGIILGLFLD